MSKTEIDRIVELQVPTAAVCIDGVCEVPAHPTSQVAEDARLARMSEPAETAFGNGSCSP